MSIFHPYTIFPLGDSALVIDFGNSIDEAINKKVYALYDHLNSKTIPYIKDMVPAFSSLAIYYDVAKLYALNRHKTAFEIVAELVERNTGQETTLPNRPDRTIKIPVCYAPKFSPDLEEIAMHKNISAQEVIHLHTSVSYRVYMLGFLPGFPYMGQVDERIAFPRKTTPRLSVHAGSVGIAGRQTGIYPLNSPGGWQIIGRTPVCLFNQDEMADAVFFKPGDQVSFYSINEDEFEHYKTRHS